MQIETNLSNLTEQEELQFIYNKLSAIEQEAQAFQEQFNKEV
jgi:hypothetical protein